MNSFVLQLILLLLLIVNYQNYCLACKGCVQLDEYNFDKVIKRFKIALIKFDVSYPYGDKHEIFTKLADELKTNDNIIIGEIGIKDYGEHDNQKFAEQLGITKDNLPTLRLIINNNDDDITIIKTITNRDEWSVDNLRNLIRDNTHLYIGLPGCLEKYDKIAVDFIQMKNVEQMTIVERIEKEAVEIDDKNELATVQIYLKYMRKIMEIGGNFIRQESERLSKILKDAKLHERKKTEMLQRFNILKSFKLPPQKDEF